MGFGKLFAGAACAVGAVVLAPVVLPAVAVAGSAAVAAAGTAAGAVVSAAASSAVGTAAISAMSAVGSAVGTAAGAAGLASVATVAGTSTGAAAVGTIATSGAIGVASATSGGKKLKAASELKEKAEQIYDTARSEFDKEQEKTNNKLEKLGVVKVDAWNKLKTYVDNVEKIKNIDFEGELQLDDKLDLDVNQLADIKILAVTIKDAISGGAAALTGGQLIGLATSTGFTSIATASTGTAIAGLHGVAATNASLAALGGGALEAGGLGMAGGAVVMNALTFAPAIAIGGIFLNSKGKKNLEAANDIYEQSLSLEKDMKNATKELKKLGGLATKMKTTISKYSSIFDEYINWLAELVTQKDDFKLFTKEEKMKFKVSFVLAVILKNLTCTELMNDKNELQSQAVSNAIDKSKEDYDLALAA